MSESVQVGDIVGIYNRTHPAVITEISPMKLFGGTSRLFKIFVQGNASTSWVLSDQVYKI